MLHDIKNAYRKVVADTMMVEDHTGDVAEVKIYKRWFPTTNENGDKSGYWGLTTKTGNHLVSTIRGSIDIETEDLGNGEVVEWAVLDGKRWALRDVIKLASKGAYGLMEV